MPLPVEHRGAVVETGHVHGDPCVGGDGDAAEGATLHGKSQHTPAFREGIYIAGNGGVAGFKGCKGDFTVVGHWFTPLLNIVGNTEGRRNTAIPNVLLNIDLDFDHFLGAVGEVALAAGSNQDHVFDTAAVLAFDVDTGFDGDDLTDLEGGVAHTAGNAGLFVDFQTYTVAEGVTEVALVACVVDEVARDFQQRFR